MSWSLQERARAPCGRSRRSDSRQSRRSRRACNARTFGMELSQRNRWSKMCYRLRAGYGSPRREHVVEARRAEARVLPERVLDEGRERQHERRPRRRHAAGREHAEHAPDDVVVHAELRGDGAHPEVLGVEQPPDLRLDADVDRHDAPSRRTSRKSPRPRRRLARRRCSASGRTSTS